MKLFILCILASLAAHTVFAEEMPAEVKRLKKLRDEKVSATIKDIDALYYRELKNLLKNYSAQGKYAEAAYIEHMLIAAADRNSPSDKTPEKPVDDMKNDELIMGTWKTVDFVKSIDRFDPSSRWWKGELFLKQLDFQKDGTVLCRNQKVDEYEKVWAEGKVDPESEWPAHYHVRTLNGEAYLFYEWISGDVTVRGMKPHYYVLRKK